MKLTTLHALYIEELKDLYSAGHQVLRALPKMAKLATAPRLREAFTDQIHQMQVHVDRLDKMFNRLGVGPKGNPCRAMESLITENKDLVADEAQPTVVDAALIAGGQRLSHFLMAGFGTTRTFARTLGHATAVTMLQEMLDENAATESRLTELAETIVRAPALVRQG